MNLLAETLTVLLAVASITAAALRPLAQVRRFLLATPLRRVARNPSRWTPEGQAIAEFLRDEGKRRQPREIRRFLKMAMDSLLRPLDGEDVLPADVLADLNMAQSDAQLKTVDTQAFALSVLMRTASTSRPQSLLGRILYPEDVERMRHLLRSVAEHLHDFALAEPVTFSRQIVSPPTGQDGSNAATFADFASALSGAIVLADSVTWRSRFGSKVLLWHDRTFRHAGSTEGSLYSSFDQAHPQGRPCSLREHIPDRKVGDFDRRVLNLRSVTSIESSSKGWTGFLLETGETCYLTTEQGGGLFSSNHDGHSDAVIVSPIGCKHLLPSPHSSQSPRVQAGQSRVELVQNGQAPVTLITAYVSVLTSDNKLVLVRRSGQVRHGRDVISATAGGVVEPEGEGSEGDIDQSGMPSLVSCVRREAVEEIGLILEDEALRPVAVFLSNIRSRASQNSDSHLDSRAGRGQMVAVVLFLAQVRETFSELQSISSSADLALGKFEVDSLLGVDLEPGSESWSLSEFARANANVLDQHGLLSCVYAAATLNGPAAARQAFEEAFSDCPWWNTDVEPFNIRLVRDPRVIINPVGLSLHAKVAWEEIGPSSWKVAWSNLVDSLTSAAIHMNPKWSPEEKTGGSKNIAP